VDRVKSLSNDGSELNIDVSEERQRQFQRVIIKCVLQLMLIQTVNDLLAKDTVYFAYPATHLMELMSSLGKSFHFAKKFNMDNDLRMALFKFGKNIV
jgi:brefeldin A-inhibited guanine nucleotide-exchange protein